MRFRRRLLLLYLVFCVGLGVVWLRASQLQLLDGDAWAAAARKMRQHTEPLEARRGAIISADGKILAQDAHVFQLAVSCWEWQRRGRARCPDCRAMYFERGTNLKRIYIPTRCACARYAQRGGSGELQRDAYPRSDITPETSGRLERLPDGDLSAFEKALELKPGELARRVGRRIDEIDAIIAAMEKAARAKGDSSPFLQSRLDMKRQDLLMRPNVIVARVAPEVARLVLTDEDGRYRGLRIVDALRRHYPQGNFAPHVLGWTSQLASRAEYVALVKRYGEAAITPSTRVGRRGLEKSYNAPLHGTPGRRTLGRDKDGQFTKVLKDKPPRPGRTLYSSIDLGVSREAERILGEIGNSERTGGYFPGGLASAGFVMLDANTGEILVWAETPSFDLNKDLDTLYDVDDAEPIIDEDGLRAWRPRGQLDGALTLEAWQQGLVVPVPLTLSRNGQVAVEPGSTMKPFIALAMLSSGRPLPFQEFTCGGRGKPYCHCHRSNLDLEGAICSSCNRYFAFSLRDSKYWPHYRRSVGAFIDSLGFGQAPTSECAEWEKGQWLWPWIDFELADVTARAQAILREKHADAGITLTLRLAPGTPARVGGNRDRLAAKLAKLAVWTGKHSGSRTLQLGVAREKAEGSSVTLRFGMRAAGRAAWFALPGTRASQPLPRVLAAMPAERRGIDGSIEQGGTAWFRVAFPKRVGRSDPQEPPVILPPDGRNVAIGQGPVVATPLQLARAVALIANGGVLVEPHAVRAIGTRRTTFERRRLPIEAAHLDRVRSGMWAVVNTPQGTAHRHPRWRDVPAEVSGKTGTAQVGKSWRPWTLTKEEQQEIGPWHHWFVGFAEAPGQRTVAFACVFHSRTEAAAGLTSAPAAQQILTQWYASGRSLQPAAPAGRKR